MGPGLDCSRLSCTKCVHVQQGKSRGPADLDNSEDYRYNILLARSIPWDYSASNSRFSWHIYVLVASTVRIG